MSEREREEEREGEREYIHMRVHTHTHTHKCWFTDGSADKKASTGAGSDFNPHFVSWTCTHTHTHTHTHTPLFLHRGVALEGVTHLSSEPPTKNLILPKHLYSNDFILCVCNV